MTLGNVVDKLHDEHGLAYAGTAEETDFTAFAVRLEKVDDLDAGSKNLGADSKVFEFGSGLVNRAQVFAFELGKLVDSLTHNIEQTSFDLVSCGDGDRALEIDNGESAAKAVGAFHGHTAHCVLSDVLFDFENEFGAVFAVYFKRGVNRGQYHIVAIESDIDYRADYLRDFTFDFAHC